jgi:hypothetical protein
VIRDPNRDVKRESECDEDQIGREDEAHRRSARPLSGRGSRGAGAAAGEARPGQSRGEPGA